MIEAILNVQVELAMGPPIEDQARVIRWLAADGNPIGLGRGGTIEFEVCQKCANPDDCPTDSNHSVSLYRARITAAGYDD